MSVLKPIGLLLLVVATAILIMLILGSRIPPAHVASATVVIAASQARVWRLIEDTASQPQWRPDLKAVAPLPPHNGHTCWMEIQKYGKMPLCEILTAAPSTRVVLIDDPTLPFGGTWTYHLEPSGTGSKVTITEDGEVYNVFFRFLSRFVFGYTSTIDTYLNSLGKKLGDSIMIR